MSKFRSLEVLICSKSFKASFNEILQSLKLSGSFGELDTEHAENNEHIIKIFFTTCTKQL